MKSLGEVLQLTVQRLKERRVAEELVAAALQCSRLQLYMHFDKPLVEAELETIRTLVRRKLKGEPLEYILGRVTFYGCTLQITPAVLIPRVESEVWLDKACALLRSRRRLAGKKAWDVCTGSGCLGIGLKKTFPELDVTLADLSPEALALAQANAAANQAAVTCVQGDLLAPFAGQKVDIVLCNPPYISKQEYAVLDRSVKEFEPRMALEGGEDGLHFYKRLRRELPGYLNPQALVFLEIGAQQGQAVRALFQEPYWRSVSLGQDWAGHDRFFLLEFE